MSIINEQSQIEQAFNKNIKNPMYHHPLKGCEIIKRKDVLEDRRSSSGFCLTHNKRVHYSSGWEVGYIYNTCKNVKKNKHTNKKYIDEQMEYVLKHWDSCTAEELSTRLKITQSRVAYCALRLRKKGYKLTDKRKQ